MPDPRRITDYFTGLADVYDAHRPRYAAAAIEALLDGLPAPADVADVGCGTGIASRQLAAAGASVIGIEPNAEMLDVARAAPGDPIDYRLASAEATGLADASVDLVVSAQAFHWFEPTSALVEFHRILRPGGRLGLMWNERLERDPVSAAYAEIVRRAKEAARQSHAWSTRNRMDDPTAGGHFTAVRRHAFDNPQVLDRDGLMGRARSASYFPRRDPLRALLERALQELFDTHAREGSITIRQRTALTIARSTK